MDLSYLDRERWEAEYTAKVLSAHVMKSEDVDFHAARGVLRGIDNSVQEVTVFYRDLKEFEELAKKFGVMDNIKANVPRTAYHGIVSFWQPSSTPPSSLNRKIHLAPRDLSASLTKVMVTSSTDYDSASKSKRDKSFLRPRIQY